jgi:hypothetical protein
MFRIAINKLFNGSFLACSHPTEKAQVRFPANKSVSGPWMEMTLVKYLHSGDPDAIYLACQ